MGNARIKQNAPGENQTGFKIVGAGIILSILGCGAVAHPRVVWDARDKDQIRGIYERQQQARFIEIITQPICGA
jgi:hypothetical protein